MKIIQAAIIMSSLFFIVLSGILELEWAIEWEEDNHTMLFVVSVIIALAGLLIGDLLFKMILRPASATQKLQDKIMYYQKAMIVKAAVKEMAIITAIIGYTISSAYFLLALTGILIGSMLMDFPTERKISTILKLSTDDQIRLRD